jgi:tellurite resistance protein TerC
MEEVTTEVYNAQLMTWVPWLVFVLLILFLLALDLGVFHRKSKVIPVKAALAWSVFWIFLALLFNAAIYGLYERHWFGIGLQVGEPMGGRQASLLFFTGYLVEKSLSLDNIFVIAVIFSYFCVPAAYQHRVLFWGVLGALVLRGVMIAVGAVMIQTFWWTIYLFGGILLVTAIKMLFMKQEHLEPKKNPLVRLARRFCPVTDQFEGDRLLLRRGGKWAITPLMLALLVVESTDVLFAVDSIPAIFGITQDPFLVFTSNVFAILGLRSLYFVLAGLMEKFRYLKTSLAFVLAFVGVKMLLEHHYEISPLASLAVIVGILAAGTLASLIPSGDR